jgi:outer membrane immunogenic protein
MKKLVFVGIALGTLGAAALGIGSASAADLSPMYTKAPPAAVPAGYDWSGIYLGAHVGGAWATNDLSDPGLGFLALAGFGVPVVQTTDSSGVIGGIQGGWNYQFGRFVLGTELDFSWADVNGTSTSTFAPAILGPGTSISRSLTANTDWIGTSTLRLGYARDRVLFYSKVGAAFAHTNYTSTWVGNGPGGGTLFTGTGDKTNVGWTVGFGAEWAFWNNWSAKLEYDYMNFGSKTIPINGVIGPGVINAPGSFGVVNEQQINEVKFGINYKFLPVLW